MLWNSALYCLLILTLNVCIDFTEGLTWTVMPSQISRCTGQTASLGWKYMKEPGEEIRQLQWLFNRTHLIAYSSVKQGFNIDVKYQGRVERSGETGILIYNLSTKDVGYYTLYPLIAWETTPNIQSVWLNVKEPTTEHWCTCEHFVQDLRSEVMLNKWEKETNTFSSTVSGEKLQFHNYTLTYNTRNMIYLVTCKVEGCNIQINSSFCCVNGPRNKYCESNPEKLCVPVRDLFNQAKSITHHSIVTQHKDSGLVGGQIKNEDPNKVPSSLASAFTPWIKCNWSVAVAMIVVKYGLGF